jgi:hypothetical protein
MSSDIHDPFNDEGQLSMGAMRLLAEQAAAANAQMVNGSLHGVYGPAGSVVVNTGQSVGVRGWDTRAYFLPGDGGRLTAEEATARRQARQYTWFVSHPSPLYMQLYDGPLAGDFAGAYLGAGGGNDGEGAAAHPYTPGFYATGAASPSAPPAELPAEPLDAVGPVEQFIRPEVRTLQVGEAYTGLAWVDRGGGVFEIVLEPATDSSPGALTAATQLIGGYKTFEAEVTSEDSILIRATAHQPSHVYPEGVGQVTAGLYTRGVRLMTYGLASPNGTDPETYTYSESNNDGQFGPPADDALIICDPDVYPASRQSVTVAGDLFGFESGHKHYEIDWRGGRIRWYDPLYGYDPVPPQPNWPGSKGRMTTDGTYLYVCVAANSWKRVLIDVW